MKRIFLVFTVLIFALRLPAQTNAPVRLALIAESADASAAVDVLTAQFSGNKNLQMLERNEIEKVYREQGLSVGNKDYLKLGQILGADGLLLAETATEGTNQFLNVRLVAVKPGVVLIAETFPWPVAGLTEWSAVFANHLNPLLPKLTVLVKDAIPISVVNLRSAISSGDATEIERQLKLLAIQRLSREPRFFVLERQKMQLLTEEKDLKLDDSAFWNGSYLLEGVVDQNGYSKDTITINARLTPPKGGAPVLIEVSGSRTNFAEVINQLALKVNEALKISSTVKTWNAADEAQQYFEEAKWAMRWAVLPEAQAAADSAWVLGKKDLECATLRVTAYMSMIPEVVSPDIGGYSNGKPGFHFVHVNDIPNPRDIDYAIHSLKLYYDFCISSPQGEPKTGSDWHSLGMENLTLASGILQQCSLASEPQLPVAEKLAELRAQARSVAEVILKSPSVYNSYYPSNHIATSLNFTDAGHDFLLSWLNGSTKTPNIFECAIQWGCFWQERPEDGVAFYRELMSSPLFFSHQSEFLFRGSFFPRLAAWNEEDKKRIPVIWRSFLEELDTSTNNLYRLEVKALECADARAKAWVGKSLGVVGIEQVVDSDTGWKASRQALLDFVTANYEAIVTNNKNLLRQDWGMNSLLGEKSEYASKFAQLHAAGEAQQAFEEQKQFLKDGKPFDPLTFAQIFISGFKDYSKAQALEILPLLAEYKTNLTGIWASTGAMQVGQVEANVNRILNPPVPSPQPSVQPPASKPATVAKTVVAPPVPIHAPEIVTNILTVNKFLEIPLDALQGDQVSDVIITAHHWLGGKLLLNLQYGLSYVHLFHAIAILDPTTEHWDVMDVADGNNSTLLHGNLFTSDGGQIKKYDFQNQTWKVLPISDGSNYELFAINDRLYAANGSMIFEIIDDGKSTHILASNRRQPPVSVLDTQDLGSPTLFEGPNHSLRACTKSKIFTWTGNDWREDFVAPSALGRPEIFMDGLVFRRTDNSFIEPDSLSRLMMGAISPELCIWQKFQPAYSGRDHILVPNAEHFPKPLWTLPVELALANLSTALCASNLYALEDHSEMREIFDNQQVIAKREIVEKDGYNAALLCFSPGQPQPRKLYLKFEAPDGCPPVACVNSGFHSPFPFMPPGWLLFTSNYLFFGLEGSRGVGYKTGVWLMPISQLEPAFAAQKQIQIEQETLAAAVTNKIKKLFLEKYDHNHNGVIDPEEKAASLDDPAFIASQLDVIDANHNGWVDLKELAYFDANKNKILEPKEQAGIEIAQQLLAEGFFKQFDANGDGGLDRSELNHMVQAYPDITHQAPSAFLYTLDINHDGHIDLGELKVYLDAQTLNSLQSRGTPGGSRFMPALRPANQPADPRQKFKMAVESYWQNPGGTINQSPPNNIFPGAGLLPNRGRMGAPQ